jgi:ribonuclease HIII
MHSKALDGALKKRFVPWGMLDQFSKQPLVQNYFQRAHVQDDANVKFDLRMMTKAESDPVVAAASVVARAEYIRQMRKLSAECGEILRKGVSEEVKAQAKRIVEKFGPEGLLKFCKRHFKTAYEVLGLPPPSETDRL